MSDKKLDGHALGEDEEERIGDEAELDDLDDEEFEPSACPICREDYSLQRALGRRNQLRRRGCSGRNRWGVEERDIATCTVDDA